MVMLSTKQVATLLGVSDVTLLNWRRRGILVPDYTTPTGRYKYSEEQIEEYIQKYITKKQSSEETSEKAEECITAQ